MHECERKGRRKPAQEEREKTWERERRQSGGDKKSKWEMGERRRKIVEEEKDRGSLSLPSPDAWESEGERERVGEQLTTEEYAKVHFGMFMEEREREVW